VGTLQPVADILKLLFKEELRPLAADRWLFALAPILSVTAAFSAFAVVPWGGTTTLFGLLPEPVPLRVADVNVGILVLFAITSMASTGSCWRAGARTASTRCSAGSGRRHR